MPSPKSPKSGGSGSGTPTEGAKVLQERLHQLLTRLSSTIELIKTWPSTDGDDASIHVETTTRLLSAILEVINALQRVETVVKQDTDLRKTLNECPIPLDLLDLLDYGNGLNPDCFSRGLLREALGQLAGLKRRKLALEMLGTAVQHGLRKRDIINNVNTTTRATATSTMCGGGGGDGSAAPATANNDTKKRDLSSLSTGEGESGGTTESATDQGGGNQANDDDDGTKPPAAKKLRMD